MQDLTVSPLPILEEIQKKGFLKSNILPLYCQKLGYAFAQFFEQTPVSSQKAEMYMEKLNTTGKSNPAFYSLFQKTMLDLYDRAMVGGELIKAQADVQLLYFFTQAAPKSIEQKKALLEKINAMSQLERKGSLLTNVIYTLSDHYVQNHQYNEDSGKTIPALLKGILDATSGKKSRYNCYKNPAFLYCANMIKSHAPVLYNAEWERKFNQKARHMKLCIPHIEEAVNIGPRKAFCHNQNAHYSSFIRE